MSIGELTAIEEIKTVKAKYFYAVDTKDWDLLASLFTADATMDFSGEADLAAAGGSGSVVASDSWTFTGGEAFAGWVESVCADIVTVHVGHDPIISLTDERSATAVWPLADRLETGDEVFLGFGHYHDEYLRTDGGWLIARTVLKRIAGVRQRRDVVLLPTGSPVAR